MESYYQYQLANNYNSAITENSSRNNSQVCHERGLKKKITEAL